MKSLTSHIVAPVASDHEKIWQAFEEDQSSLKPLDHYNECEAIIRQAWEHDFSGNSIYVHSVKNFCIAILYFGISGCWFFTTSLYLTW